MIKRLKPYYSWPDENKEKHELAEWAFNSHYWIETDPGYYRCKWCNRQHTSEMSISWKFPICPNNPSLKWHREKHNES